MILCVTGGRDFTDRTALRRRLTELHHEVTIDLLIEGGARGADRIAREWAVDHSVPVRTVLADWDKFGKAAGMIRNQRMADLRPHLVLACPGGRGTSGMVSICERAGLIVERLITS